MYLPFISRHIYKNKNIEKTMNQKRFAGFALILAGILLSLSRIVITGAVVGVEKSSFAGFSGGLMVFIGLVLAAQN